MSRAHAVDGSKGGSRPGAVYLLLLFQFLVAVVMILGVQGLFIRHALAHGSDDEFNVGVVLGIIDLGLVMIAAIGPGWARRVIVTFAVVGIAASVAGSAQAFLNHTASTATTVGPELPIVPIVGELVVLYLVSRPATRSFFGRRQGPS